MVFILKASDIQRMGLETYFELLMRDMEAFLLIAMHESIAVRKEERSSTEVLASPFPRGLNLLRVRTRSSKRSKSEYKHEKLFHLCMGLLLCKER